MNLPTSYRGIIRLSKKHGIKLTPCHTLMDIKFGKCCVLALLAYENGLNNYIGKLKYTHDKKLNDRMNGLESGFENWYQNLKLENSSIFRRYYEVGQRLRQYAGYDLCR